MRIQLYPRGVPPKGKSTAKIRRRLHATAYTVSSPAHEREIACFQISSRLPTRSLLGLFGTLRATDSHNLYHRTTAVPAVLDTSTPEF